MGRNATVGLAGSRTVPHQVLNFLQRDTFLACESARSRCSPGWGLRPPELDPEDGTTGLVGRGAVPNYTERTMRQRTRRKIDGALKAKIALKALGEQATVSGP